MRASAKSQAACEKYAATDELHQGIVAGRHLSVLDVGIDAAGLVAAGLVAAGLVAAGLVRIVHLRRS